MAGGVGGRRGALTFVEEFLEANCTFTVILKPSLKVPRAKSGQKKRCLRTNFHDSWAKILLSPKRN